MKPKGDGMKSEDVPMKTDDDEISEVEVDEGLRPWKKHIECPHCHKRLKLNFKLKLNEVLLDSGDAEAGKDRDESRFLPDELRLIRQAQETGMLEAFKDAWNTNNLQSPLSYEKSVSKAFLQYLKLATTKRVPSFVLNAFYKEFPGQLAFNGANGVVAVISDGKLCAFFPQKLVVGGKLGKIGGGQSTASFGAKLPVNENALNEWIRTKHGYVAGRGLYFEAMQMRSRGDFADVSLTRER
jgi:hypothetical protein